MMQGMKWYHGIASVDIACVWRELRVRLLGAGGIGSWWIPNIRNDIIRTGSRDTNTRQYFAPSQGAVLERMPSAPSCCQSFFLHQDSVNEGSGNRR